MSRDKLVEAAEELMYRNEELERHNNALTKSVNKARDMLTQLAAVAPPLEGYITRVQEVLRP